MIYIILLLTFLFSLKSIILNYFYSNKLIYLYFPIELSLLSFDIDSKFNIYNSIIKWFFFGFIETKNDIKTINKIDKYNEYCIIISTIFSFIIYLICFIIKNKKQINKYKIIELFLKYILINYTSFYVLNLNNIINYDKTNYLSSLVINVFLFNFIIFWFPGIIFKYIYGDELYIYRKKYSFLIEYYNPKYKYFTILFLYIKSLTLIYIILYNKFNIISNYSLIFIILFIIIFQTILSEIFTMSIILKNNIFIVLFSFLITILNIVEYYYNDIFYLKICIFSINIILFIYYNTKNKIESNQDIELNTLV
jgi:hypothetical protein